MPLCCVECKPCNGHCLPGPPGGLFKSRRPAQQLRRALGKMKVGGTCKRPRRPGSFSSVRAVFWPLMSMRSEADARNDDTRLPTETDSPDDTASSGGARAPPLSVQDDGGGAASTTAARVLALQARLGGDAKVSVAAAAAGDEAKAIVRHGDVGGDVEAACRSFERHLMEMLVEERKVMDLTDVEELLCCWEKLRCPAFVRLVGRFYGELCVDLFSSAQDADDAWSSQSEDLSVV